MGHETSTRDMVHIKLVFFPSVFRPVSSCHLTPPKSILECPSLKVSNPSTTALEQYRVISGQASLPFPPLHMWALPRPLTLDDAELSRHTGNRRALLLEALAPSKNLEGPLIQRLLLTGSTSAVAQAPRKKKTLYSFLKAPQASFPRPCPY